MSSGIKIQNITSLAEATAAWKSLCKDDSAFEDDPPHFVSMMVAERSGISFGCICLYRNPFIQIDGRKTLLFGNMHFPDDPGISSALLHACFEYGRSEKYDLLFGPMNGNTWNSYRLPLNNFGTRFLSDLSQPAYYYESLNNAGFSLVEEYHSFLSIVEARTIDPALIHKLDTEGIRIRNIRMKDYQAELEKIFDFCQGVFAENLYFSPVSKDLFISKYLSIARFIDPDFVLLAETPLGNLKAIYFVFPDVISPNRLVVKTIAREPGEEIKGIMVLMSQQVYNKAFEKGYRDMVHAFAHSSNRSVKLSKRFNGRPFKNYGLFLKDIDGR